MVDQIQGRRPRRWPQFTIKSTLVTMLIVGLGAGWVTDRYRTQATLRKQIDEQTRLREEAETSLGRLSNWVAAERSLDGVPRELRDLVEDATTRTIDPEEGFRLFRVRNAQVTLAYADLTGNSFRVRGGPLRYELLSEDLSQEEPRVVYRFVGPESDKSQNTDGVLTYCRPRRMFKPHRVGSDLREPSGKNFIVTFSQDSFAPLIIPAHEVWPDWIYTAPGVGSMRIGGLTSRDTVLRENEPMELFFIELSSTDGRKARVQLTVTCAPRVSAETGREANPDGNATSLPANSADADH